MPIKIRSARVSDAAEIVAIYAPIVAETAISFELEPPTREVMAERISTTFKTFPWLVAECEGALIGYAYASQHRERAAYRWSVDVSAYVRDDMRGVGVGRALYTALLEILRRQAFRCAFAGITLPNAASVGLHEAMGFELLGIYREVGFKLGRWHDVGWWRLELTTRVAPPAEPIPFASLADPSER